MALARLLKRRKQLPNIVHSKMIDITFITPSPAKQSVGLCKVLSELVLQVSCCNILLRSDW